MACGQAMRAVRLCSRTLHDQRSMLSSPIIMGRNPPEPQAVPRLWPLLTRSAAPGAPAPTTSKTWW